MSISSSAWLGGGAAALAAAAGAQTPPQPSAISAWIAEEPAQEGFVFVAYVRAKNGFTGRYELVSERAGPSGRSSVRQAGAIVAAPGETVRLTQVGLGSDRVGHQHDVTLRVLAGQTVLAQDRRSQ